MWNLKESLLLMVWTHRLTGLTILELPENVPWPKLTAFYVIALGSCYSYVLWSRLNMSVESVVLVPLVSVVFRIILIFNVITAFLVFIIFWIQRKNHLKVGRRIELVDETLQSFGIDPKYKEEQRDYRKLIFLFLIAIIVLFTSSIVIYSNICDTYSDAFIQTFSFIWPQVLHILIELNFIILLVILQKRFEKVNALLSNAVRNSSQTGSYKNIDKYNTILMDNQHDEISTRYYAKIRNNLEYLLPTTRQLHLDLCSISRFVNRIMGIQIAMQMGVKFVLLTGYSYAFYLIYQEENMPFQIKLNFLFFAIIRIVYGTLHFYFIIRTSENITAEAQTTSQITQEIENNEQKILDEIHQYSLQIMHNPLYFTAYGLYKLDFNFVQSFAGTVVFYLIILIQNQPSISKTADAIVAQPQLYK